jgi:hypothetical protein
MSDETGIASLKGQGILFFSEGVGLALYAIVVFVTRTETDVFAF